MPQAKILCGILALWAMVTLLLPCQAIIIPFPPPHHPSLLYVHILSSSSSVSFSVSLSSSITTERALTQYCICKIKIKLLPFMCLSMPPFSLPYPVSPHLHTIRFLPLLKISFPLPVSSIILLRLLRQTQGIIKMPWAQETTYKWISTNGQHISGRNCWEDSQPRSERNTWNAFSVVVF